jgi:hypothetical protein
MTFTNPRFRGMVFNLRLRRATAYDASGFQGIPHVGSLLGQHPAPTSNGTTFIGSSPELFGYWLEQTLHQTRVRHQSDERMIFINAWNEWEGCHLRTSMDACLEAILQRSLHLPSAPTRLVPTNFSRMRPLSKQSWRAKSPPPQASESYPAAIAPSLDVAPYLRLRQNSVGVSRG